MLRKLYKNEFYSLFRNMLPIYAGLIGLALLSRLSFLIDAQNIPATLLKGGTAVLFVLGIIAMFIIGLVIIVVRFYKNLLSSEGYLTFTLPFKASQHINCKLLSGALVIFVNVLVLAASLLLFGAGTDAEKAVFDAIGQLWNVMLTDLSAGHIALIIGECFLFFCCYLFEALLMFYAAMAIGQRFKSKIGGAVLSYICIYAAVQIISLVVLLPLTIAGTLPESFTTNNIAVMEIFFGILLVYNIILSVVYYCITRYMLTKKLNLE